MKTDGMLFSRNVKLKSATKVDCAVYGKKTPVSDFSHLGSRSVISVADDITFAKEISQYFQNVRLGQVESTCVLPAQVFNVPYIAFFIDDDCREEYLRRSEKSTKEKQIKFRNMLKNPALCERELSRIILAIAKTCGENRISEFRHNIFVSTPNKGERRIKLCLNLSGKPVDIENSINSEGTTYFDLTLMYNSMIAFGKGHLR